MDNKITEVIALHKKLVEDLEKNSIKIILKIVETICKSLKDGGCIYLCGNGGSAADAQHIAAEFIVRFKHNRKSLPAVSLTTDSSVLTSIGNDYSFEETFSKQIESLVEGKDILWVLSTSGKSENILAAVKLARQKGAKVIAFTGKPGNELEKASDITLTVDTSLTSSAQEIHELAYHIICGLVEEKFLSN